MIEQTIVDSNPKPMIYLRIKWKSFSKSSYFRKPGMLIPDPTNLIALVT